MSILRSARSTTCYISALTVFPLTVSSGEYKKDELLEAARSGNEERLLSLLTPLNVNCHASDGRKSTPLHLASGYNRTRIVNILLQNGADVHAKDKGYVSVLMVMLVMVGQGSGRDARWGMFMTSELVHARGWS